METLIESYGNKITPISYWTGNNEEENFDYNFLLGLAPQQNKVTIKGVISESDNKQTLSYGHISLGVDKKENKIYIQKDDLTEDEEKEVKFDIFEIEFSSHDEKIILYYDYTQRLDESYSLLFGKYDTNKLQIVELSDNKLELSIPEIWWERDNMAYTLEFPISFCQDIIIEEQESSIVIDSIKLRVKCPNFERIITETLKKSTALPYCYDQFDQKVFLEPLDSTGHYILNNKFYYEYGGYDLHFDPGTFISFYIDCIYNKKISIGNWSKTLETKEVIGRLVEAYAESVCIPAAGETTGTFSFYPALDIYVNENYSYSIKGNTDIYIQINNKEQ